jgi:carbon storage regulator
MLVLSRKVGEQIVIDNNIVLTVVEVRGDRIKLGFAGPKHVPIHRAEVFQRIEAAQERPSDWNSERAEWPTEPVAADRPAHGRSFSLMS